MIAGGVNQFRQPLAPGLASMPSRRLIFRYLAVQQLEPGFEWTNLSLAELFHLSSKRHKSSTDILRLRVVMSFDLHNFLVKT